MIALTTTPLQQVIDKASAELAQLDEQERTRQQQLVSLQQALTSVQQAVQEARNDAAPGDHVAIRTLRALELQEKRQEHAIVQSGQQASQERERDAKRSAELLQVVQKYRTVQEELDRLQGSDENRATALGQMIQNATSKIDLLTKEETELQSRLKAIQAQVVTAQARIDDAVSRATQAKGQAAEAQSAYALAQTQEGIARGTLVHDEKAALLEVQALHLQTAEKDRDALVSEAEAVQSKNAPLLKRLGTEFEQCQARLRAIPNERLDLERAKSQAHLDLGEEIRHQVQLHLHVADATVTVAQSHLDEANEARITFIQQSVEQLTQWSGLQREFKRLLPLDDPTYHILKAEQAYLKTLLEHRFQLVDSLPLPSTQHLYQWWKMLEVPYNEMYGVEHLKGPATSLHGRLARVEQTIRELEQLRGR